MPEWDFIEQHLDITSAEVVLPKIFLPTGPYDTQLFDVKALLPTANPACRSFKTCYHLRHMFPVLGSYQQIPTILAYSSATFSKHYQLLFKLHVIIASDRLTLDTTPSVPFINGLLPVPPQVSLNLPIVHVRYDALMSATPTAHFKI
jgi:hypothetical protein